MGVVGFSYLKINAERGKKAASKAGIEVGHNLSIVSVDKAKLQIGSAQAQSDALRIEFSLDISYGSGVGKISLLGDIIYVDTKEIIEETLKGWEKEKVLNAQVRDPVYRYVHAKGVVKALEISNDLNLPAPIPLPRLQFDAKKAKK